jgi:hypothetical protein
MMTTTLCFIAWLYAVLSDKNESTGLAFVCFLAWVSSI